MTKYNDTPSEDYKELATRIAQSLETWYEHEGRPLPWRRQPDVYSVWLSEIIMQQTRIEQGTAYWERFMTRYPSVSNLATANEDEVLKLWQGLGYYSRARHLLEAARIVYAAGCFPQTAAEWIRLPGVGAYTAAAISSIIYGERVAAIDGNAYRVFSRLFDMDTPTDTTDGKNKIKAYAQAIIDACRQPGNLNQAVMDLGATVCTPRQPLCTSCPLAAQCMAYEACTVAQRPVKSKKTKINTRHLYFVFLRYNGCTALGKRTKGDIWQGLWQPILTETLPLPTFGGTVREVAKDVRHVLTHQVLLASMYEETITKSVTLPPGYQWVPEDRLDDYAFPRLIEKLLQRIKR